MDWVGPTPVYLMIVTHDGEDESVIIDLDRPQWAKLYAEWMRRPAVWFLLSKKSDLPALTVWVHDGDQPYYTARHVGVTGSGGGNEITAYGIGKKRPDGEMVRLWVMPNGMVCGGDDVSDFGIRMVKALGPKEVSP